MAKQSHLTKKIKQKSNRITKQGCGFAGVFSNHSINSSPSQNALLTTRLFYFSLQDYQQTFSFCTISPILKKISLNFKVQTDSSKQLAEKTNYIYFQKSAKPLAVLSKIVTSYLFLKNSISKPAIDLVVQSSQSEQFRQSRKVSQKPCIIILASAFNI